MFILYRNVEILANPSFRPILVPPAGRIHYRRLGKRRLRRRHGSERKERALTHSERQSGCRDGDFTSWSSIVLPFSPYYVKPLIILGPKEKGEEKRKMLFSPILH